MIQIDEASAIEATVYVHAHAHMKSLGSGWGVVIDRQGIATELGGHETGGTVPRLLLEATITALHTLPTYLPVRIVCSIEFLTRHVIPRLSEMHKDDYVEARRKELFHLDLYETLYKATWRRPYVTPLRVPKVNWNDHHRRAEDLARQWISVFAEPEPRPEFAKQAVRQSRLTRMIGSAFVPDADIPF